jgi:hypothetical protein
MFSPKDLSKLNETHTLAEIQQIVEKKEQEQNQEKSSQKLKRTMKQSRIEAKKAKRRSKH